MSGVTRRGAVAVAALGLVMAACADDGSEPIAAPPTTEPAVSTTTSVAATTTEAVTTTTETTTTAPTTTGPTSTTTTAPVEPGDVPYWSTACTEVAGDADATHESDPASEQFTTLGAAPSLDLVMPDVVTSAGPYPSIATASRIPGGVLVGVYPTDYWPTVDEILYSSSLVAVNDDGSIRWRRCFGEDFETRRFVVAPASLDPDVAWVLSTRWDEPLRILGFDLATGADVEFPMGADDLAGLGERGYGSERFLVLGRVAAAAEPDDRLVVVDLVDGSTTEVPVPPGWVGVDATSVYVIDVDTVEEGYVLADEAPFGDVSPSVYVDGAWTDDPGAQRALLPPRLLEPFGEPFELRFVDGAGDLLWSAPEFHGVAREGFRSAIADDVVIAMRCAEWDASGSCLWGGDGPPAEELVGFDAETGDELWVLPGTHAVPVFDGNTGIITPWEVDGEASFGYVLLDLLTGERKGPDGDPWPEGSFVEECCGGYVYVHTERDGGVVIATNEEHVRVWYPPELTQPTVTVDLMG